MLARTAENGGRVPFLLRPNFRRMTGKFRMAGVTRKPLAAAFELDRDNVALTVVMSAPRFWIDVDAHDAYAADDAFG